MMFQLEQDEKEWMIVTAAADYAVMSKMLVENPDLIKFRDFISGYSGTFTNF